MMGAHSPVLFLVGHDGTSRTSLRAPQWTEDEMRMVGRAAQRLTVVPELTPEMVRQRWPRMTPWPNRHPGLAFAIGVGVTLLARVVIIGTILALT